MTRHFILGTAGHVDHGKSALVKALTGTDPDRLPEEKARGITIDLGFAHLDLPQPNAADTSPLTPFSVGIVDVPGHEDFVKNMVAGVGAIDLALLVVAADDGWMPQTEEHLQILTYLGVTRAVVALTKADLAGPNLARCVDAVRQRLADSPLAQAPIVPTSVVTSEGLDTLQHALGTELAALPPARDANKPRLAIDRVFSLRGIGTVATGTLTDGPLRRGDTLAIQPAGRLTRVRNLQAYHRDVDEAGPGCRVAVNLPEVVATAGEATGIARGEVLCAADLGPASDTADVLLEKSSRLLTTPSAAAARPLKDSTLIRVHYGTANAAARIRLDGASPLLPGERKLAQLRFERPVFLCAGDRFIVRDWAEQTTLAGGLVLDPDARRQAWGQAATRRCLQACAAASADAATCLRAFIERDGVRPREGLLLKSRFSRAEVTAAIDRGIAGRELLAAGTLIASPAWWDALRARAAEVIDQEHRDHPERPGLDLPRLRQILEPRLAFPAVFDEVVNDLQRHGFTLTNGILRRSRHQIALPASLLPAARRIRAALAEHPLDPPSRPLLAPDEPGRQAMRFLLDAGEVLEISADVVLSTAAYQDALGRIRAWLGGRRQATVSELRQLLDSSRRIMVPLLERLDREGFTRRDGDVRIAGPKWTAPTATRSNPPA